MLINECLEERYIIIKLINEGGMSLIYLAEDLRLQRRLVVLKMLKVQFMQQSQLIKSEVEALTKLHHPALPQIYDYFVYHESQVIVMEYIIGQPLIALQAMNDMMKIKVLYQLSQVMVYLHERPVPIIHGDIKPQNIMLDEHGNVKLLDFGISMIQYQTETDKLNAQRFGTPTYMAPELFKGKKATVWADVYSYGVLILSLWHKEHLFIKHKHLPVELFCSLYLSALPKTIVNLLEYVLQQNPKFRKYSFKEIVQLLHTYNKEFSLHLHEKNYSSKLSTNQESNKIAVINLNRCAGSTTVAIALSHLCAKLYPYVHMIELDNIHSNVNMSHIVNHPRSHALLDNYNAVIHNQVTYHYSEQHTSYTIEEHCLQLEQLFQLAEQHCVIVDFSSLDERFELLSRCKQFTHIVLLTTYDCYVTNEKELFNAIKHLQSCNLNVLHIHNKMLVREKGSFLNDYINVKQYLEIPYYLDKHIKSYKWSKKWLHEKSPLIQKVKKYLSEISI